MLHDLKIFQKTYDLLFWIKPVVQKFAKAHKYSLGLQLENEVLALLKYITRANMSRDNKKVLIQECMVRYETVKVLIRLSKDYKLISLKQYEFASEKLLEIGRMLGGWLKHFSAGGGVDSRSYFIQLYCVKYDSESASFLKKADGYVSRNSVASYAVAIGTMGRILARSHSI